jgi:glutaredoxin 3
MRDTMAVKVYSTPTCPWCHRAKDFLSEHKIKFEDLNVAESEKARLEMVHKTGQMGVPVIDIDGEIIIGFDEEAIKKALKIK